MYYNTRPKCAPKCPKGGHRSVLSPCWVGHMETNSNLHFICNVQVRSAYWLNVASWYITN